MTSRDSSRKTYSGKKQPRTHSTTRTTNSTPTPSQTDQFSPKYASSDGGAQKPLSKGLQYFSNVKNGPFFDYYLVIVITGVLTAIGLIMVLSSSMVTSLNSSSSAFSEFFKQAIMVIIGLGAFWFALRLKPSTLQKFSGPFLAVSIVLLVLVLFIGVGYEEVGANSWIPIFGFAFQPSEIAKLALIIWASSAVSQYSWKDQGTSILTRVLLVSAVVLGLVLLQRDFGMMISIALTIVILLFVAGIPMKFLALCFTVLAALALVALSQGAFRIQRLKDYSTSLFGHFDGDLQGTPWQSYQGMISLGEGGFLGKGLGQSSAKWNYLPEAKNDFIFAILGEELGLLGAGLVVFLFGLLAYVGVRISMRQVNPFLRYLSVTIALSLVAQAAINMGYVTGILPVTGLQLPMISAGGTSTIIALASMGILAMCARNEPESISAIQNYGRRSFDRILHVPEPAEYEPGTQLKSTPQKEYYGSSVNAEVHSVPRRSQDQKREEERRSRYARNASDTSQRYPRTPPRGQMRNSSEQNHYYGRESKKDNGWR